jgi:hypothetical protein
LVELDVHPDMVKRIGGAIQKGKAVRMPATHYNGGSLASVFKKVGKTFKPVSNAVVKNVVDSSVGKQVVKGTSKAVTAVSKDLKKNAGSYVETAKKYVPANALKAGLTAGATTAIIAGTSATGTTALAPFLIPMAVSGINTGVNATYSHDFSKKNGGQNSITNQLKEGAITEAKA